MPDRATLAHYTGPLGKLRALRHTTVYHRTQDGPCKSIGIIHCTKLSLGKWWLDKALIPSDLLSSTASVPYGSAFCLKDSFEVLCLDSDLGGSEQGGLVRSLYSHRRMKHLEKTRCGEWVPVLMALGPGA